MAFGGFTTAGTDSTGFCCWLRAHGTVSVAWFDATPSRVAMAVFVTSPTSTSACVTV